MTNGGTHTTVFAIYRTARHEFVFSIFGKAGGRTCEYSDADTRGAPEAHLVESGVSTLSQVGQWLSDINTHLPTGSISQQQFGACQVKATQLTSTVLSVTLWNAQGGETYTAVWFLLSLFPHDSKMRRELKLSDIGAGPVYFGRDSVKAVPKLGLMCMARALGTRPAPTA